MKSTQLPARERIYRLTFHLGITTRELATIAGVSEQTLYHVTDETRGVSGRTATKICNNLKKKLGVVVNRDWLLTGEGEMIVPSTTPSPAKDVTMEPAQSEINWQDKYIALLEKHIELQREYTACLKKRMQ